MLIYYWSTLVDKIIIDQESSGKFIHHLSPGAYKDLTKVDFKAMDDVNIKPVGLYGSKYELIHFLKQLEVIDDNMCVFNSCYYLKIVAELDASNLSH